MGECYYSLLYSKPYGWMPDLIFDGVPSLLCIFLVCDTVTSLDYISLQGFMKHMHMHPLKATNSLLRPVAGQRGHVHACFNYSLVPREPGDEAVL